MTTRNNEIILNNIIIVMTRSENLYHWYNLWIRNGIERCIIGK